MTIFFGFLIIYFAFIKACLKIAKMSPCPSLNSKPSSADSLIDVQRIFPSFLLHQPLSCIFYSYLLFPDSESSTAISCWPTFVFPGLLVVSSLSFLLGFCFSNYTLIYPSWVLNLALFFDSYSLSLKQRLETLNSLSNVLPISLFLRFFSFFTIPIQRVSILITSIFPPLQIHYLLKSIY